VDATVETARDLGFDWCASLYLAEGNLDVDLRYWGEENKPKHGMTPSDPKTGKPTMTAVESEAAWREWIETAGGRARDRLAQGDCRSALYYLGQALHAVQDREAHQGMTNPEHSVLELKRKSPDEDKDARDRGRRQTRKFLEAFLAELTGAEQSVLKACKCGKRLRVRRPRLNFVGPVEFKLQGVEFILNRRDPPTVRWPKTEPRKRLRTTRRK
jgi:hypothetical protein